MDAKTEELTKKLIKELKSNHGDANAIIELIRNGADVNTKVSKSGNTIGHEIAYFCNLDVLKEALNHGMDINAKNHAGWSIGHSLALFSSTEMIELALKNGLDVRDCAHKKSILKVINNDDKEAKAKLIKDHMLKTQGFWEELAVDNYAKTEELIKELRSGHNDVSAIMSLIKNGADVNASDDSGWVLHR